MNCAVVAAVSLLYQQRSAKWSVFLTHYLVVLCGTPVAKLGRS